MKNLAILIKENVALQELHPLCFAHSNKFVFKDVAALSSINVHAQDFCENLYALVGVFPKLFPLFEGIQTSMEDDKSMLPLRHLS